MKLSVIPYKEFLGKERENNKKVDEEEEEEKRNGDNDDSVKNSDGSAKRGKKMRGGIYRSASKGDNEVDADSWDKHEFDVMGKEGHSGKQK